MCSLISEETLIGLLKSVMIKFKNTWQGNITYMAGFIQKLIWKSLESRRKSGLLCCLSGSKMLLELDDIHS